MTVSEYEERFRSPTPSLHQTFVSTRGPNRARRSSRRFWVGAALVGVTTMTSQTVLHHAVQNKTSNLLQVWQPCIR
jgi:hypothetical protein